MPSKQGLFIAERNLVCVRPSGERFDVRLRVGKPYRVDSVSWACPVEATGLFKHLADIHGVDSFHSLMLGQGLLRKLVGAEIESGSQFFSNGSNEPVTIGELFGEGI